MKGYPVSEKAFNRMQALLRQAKKDRREKERAEIAALSNLDIQKIMARVIRERMNASASVTRTDFTQAGIPDHRIDKNWDAAMRLARRQDNHLDAIRAMPCAA